MINKEKKRGSAFLAEAEEHLAEAEEHQQEKES